VDTAAAGAAPLRRAFFLAAILLYRANSIPFCPRVLLMIDGTSLMPTMTDDDRDADGGRGTTGVGLATKPESKTAKPALYKVLMLNDDYTPMEFVVLTLQRFFKMSIEDATRVMLHVHQRGVGVCGIFTYEVAETKVNQVIDFARQHNHPLQCTMEKE
jgi:ATP-dependent Clp protease adaptor protein ClpS